MIRNALSRAQAKALLALTSVCLVASAATGQTAKPAVNSTNAPRPAVAVKSANVAGTAPNEVPWKTDVPSTNLISSAGWAEFVKSPNVKPRYEGRLRSEYDYRSQGDSKDADLYGYWRAAGRELSNGRFDIHTSGRLHTDLDDSFAASAASNTTYASLDDLDGVTEQRLVQLYADIHDKKRRAQLRGGRQYVDIADYLHLDGAQLILLENENLGGRVYAGIPVSYYTSVSGDIAAGVSLVMRPWGGNRTRLTYSRHEDESEDGSDNDYFLDAQQEIADTKRMRAQVSVLNGDFRLANLDVDCYSPDGETDFRFGGSRGGEFSAETRFYSPLYSVLGEQTPFTYGYARLTQVLTRHLTLSPGVSSRITDNGEANARNRDYNDFDLTLSFDPNNVFNSAISVDYWDTKGKDSFLGVSGEVRCRGGRKWDVSVGTAYLDYTYSSYSDISYSINGGQTYLSSDGTVITETPYSYTYFIRAKWNLSRNLILKLRGDIEDNSASSDISYRGRGSIEVRL